jgi:hypothetical protein
MSDRLRELAVRLVASGPKASHVSASETHEISDGLIDLLNENAKLRKLLGEAKSKAMQAIDNGHASAQVDALWNVVQLAKEAGIDE